MSYDPDSLQRELFSAAAAKWLSTRKPFLKSGSFYMAGHHIKQINKFLGEIPVGLLKVEHLRNYQSARMENAGKIWRKTAQSSLINHEMSVVQMILKRAGVWKSRFSQHYEPLPKPPSRPQKVMTDLEEIRLFSTAAKNPQWRLALIVATITINTSAAGTELRHLRFEHLYLDNAYPTFLIPPEHAKNDNRGRRIFVNETCMVAFRMAIDRAVELGCSKPEHHLFPKRVVRGKYDPDSPASASWLRNQFQELREAAGLPWLTPHCLRHQFITLMFEQGHSEQDIQSITGQLSREALRMYSHNRIERQSSILTQADPRNRKPMETSRLGASRMQA